MKRAVFGQDAALEAHRIVGRRLERAVILQKQLFDEPLHELGQQVRQAFGLHQVFFNAMERCQDAVD